MNDTNGFELVSRDKPDKDHAHMQRHKHDQSRQRAGGTLHAFIILIASTIAPRIVQGDGWTFSLPGRGYTSTDRLVSTNVFTWFAATGGQGSGPWRPLEGRSKWTGAPDFWIRQIKDMMDANIDVLHVHLMPDSEAERINLFIALRYLRTQGYDVPKVAPFLDPLITWTLQPPIDVATTAGKDAFAGQYIRFFNQYFGVNADIQAESYLLHIDGRIVLNTWHCNSGFVNNLGSLSRSDVETRLAAAFGSAHPTFSNGIYMIGTANGQAPLFCDEIMYQFSNTAYGSTYKSNSRKTATMKAGYWDQNIRHPGIFLARSGGAPYASAWGYLNSIRRGGLGVDGESLALPIFHANLESWNEYDEGTGIYAADPGPPYIAPGNTSGNTDVWSSTNNPREYIDTVAAHAAQFNDRALLDAIILAHNLPPSIFPGRSVNASIVVRNEGNTPWSDAAGFKLGQLGPVLYEWTFDSAQHGWSLVRNAFGTVGNTTYENGQWSAAFGTGTGGLRTRTGNVDGVDYSSGASTAFGRTFHLERAGTVSISFKWRLVFPRSFESNEQGEARLEIDDHAYGVEGAYLARFSGGMGYDQDTGWREHNLTLPLAGPADHRIEIGGFNSRKTDVDEFVDVHIDDVTIVQVEGISPLVPVRLVIDDTQDEIPSVGGIFRGRPKTFSVPLTAPLAPGTHDLHLRMFRENVGWFGQRLDVPIDVPIPGDFDGDGDVDQSDFGHLQVCLSGMGVHYPSGCGDADLNGDGDLDSSDFDIFRRCLSGPDQAPVAGCAG